MSMFLAPKKQLRTLFLRLLLETGPPFYVVLLVTRRSSHLQGKGSTFISQSFLDHEYWSNPRGSNPRHSALQVSALPYRHLLSLPRGQYLDLMPRLNGTHLDHLRIHFQA